MKFPCMTSNNLKLFDEADAYVAHSKLAVTGFKISTTAIPIQFTIKAHMQESLKKLDCFFYYVSTWSHWWQRNLSMGYCKKYSQWAQEALKKTKFLYATPSNNIQPQEHTNYATKSLLWNRTETFFGKEKREENFITAVS